MQVSWDITPEAARESLTEKESRQFGLGQNMKNQRSVPRQYSREYQKIVSSKSPIEILSAAK